MNASQAALAGARKGTVRANGHHAGRSQRGIHSRLELPRDAEVVHGRPDHQDVGNQEFVERRLSRGEIPHTLPIGREGALKTGEMNSGQVAERIAS